MNSKAKIVVGVVAGLIAGATVMGAAFAAPRVLSGPAASGYRMMGSVAGSGTVGIPTFAEMRSFMDRYRTSSGAIDVGRMHSDVATGKVTPPCLARSTGATGTRSGRPGQAGQGPGYSMMGRSY